MKRKILAALAALVLAGGLAACDPPGTTPAPVPDGGAGDPNFYFLRLEVHIYDCKGLVAEHDDPDKAPLGCDLPSMEVLGDVGGNYVISALAPPDENGQPRVAHVFNKTTGEAGDSPQRVQVDRYPTRDEQQVQEGMLWVRWDAHVDRVATNWRVVCAVYYETAPDVPIPQMFGSSEYYNPGPITTTGDVTCSWPIGVNPI